MQEPYVLITPLTGLSAPQGLEGRDSGVFPADVPRFTTGWETEAPCRGKKKDAIDKGFPHSHVDFPHP